MRKEALLEQWKVLYEAATHIKELKPWELFRDMSPGISHTIWMRQK
jgi:hypothetical protein